MALVMDVLAFAVWADAARISNSRCVRRSAPVGRVLRLAAAADNRTSGVVRTHGRVVDDQIAGQFGE